jgi:SlyX protein
LEDLQERLIELETRFTHQNRLIDELNDEVTACSRRIAALERDNRTLRDTLKSLAPELTESPDE